MKLLIGSFIDLIVVPVLFGIVCVMFSVVFGVINGSGGDYVNQTFADGVYYAVIFMLILKVVLIFLAAFSFAGKSKE